MKWYQTGEVISVAMGVMMVVVLAVMWLGNGHMGMGHGGGHAGKSGDTAQGRTTPVICA